MSENECIFCKIVNKDIPASVVYEDDDVVAILDISPANKGHVLVLTRKHYENFVSAPVEDVVKVMRVVHKISAKVEEKLGTEHFNVLINNGKLSGQVIPHLHVHLIPRFESDGVDIGWQHKEYKEGEMEEFRELLALE